MGHSKAEKLATHARIVKIAAARFRERGLEGIGVADIMKEAGVTVGGFYKHFETRDQLVVEALSAAFADYNAFSSSASDVAAVIENYLSLQHRDTPGMGCGLGAFLGEMSHASASVRSAYTAQVRSTLIAAEAAVPISASVDRRASALLLMSTLLGAINLSRAVNDPALSQEILETVTEQLATIFLSASS